MTDESNGHPRVDQAGTLSAEQRAELTAELDVLQNHRLIASAVGTPASVLAAIDMRIAQIQEILGA